MNKTVDPCVDFYQYACGNWIAKNPLPSDRSRWGRFTELSSHNEKVLLDVLQGAAVVREQRSPLDQKIGDAYAACMDTAAINQRGIAPVKPELDRIRAMKNMPDVVAELARLHRIGIGVLFNFGARTDAKDSNRTIAGFGQGGLSLPDREYYLKTDPKSVEIRQRFLAHMTKMFQLAGESAENSAQAARMVLELETILAKASMDRVSMRDPNKTYHMMSRQEVAQLAPNFAWDQYFQATGAPAFETLNVSQPDYIKQIAVDLANSSIDSWRAYFAYHLLRSSAPTLPEAFENEDFDFWKRYLSGAKEQRPRTARCVATVDRELGDLLGQKYIELTFGADAKAQITQLVDALEKAMAEDIRTLPWMTEETKKAALAKLKAITNNVGYPKKWRDYSKLTIARDDFFGNAVRTAQVAYEQRIDKIGKPTDKTEWSMTTPTVNAFYSPQNNSINFPGRHSADAVLRPAPRHGAQLRRSGRGDRPRDDAWIRRPGPQVRWRRQPARLVDCRPTAPSSTSAPPAWPTSIRASPRWTTSSSTAASRSARIPPITAACASRSWRFRTRCRARQRNWTASRPSSASSSASPRSGARTPRPRKSAPAP